MELDSDVPAIKNEEQEAGASADPASEEHRQKQSGNGQHDPDIEREDLLVDGERSDDGDCAADEQHIEQIAAKYVADGDVGVAMQ